MSWTGLDLQKKLPFQSLHQQKGEYHRYVLQQRLGCMETPPRVQFSSSENFEDESRLAYYVRKCPSEYIHFRGNSHQNQKMCFLVCDVQLVPNISQVT